MIDLLASIQRNPIFHGVGLCQVNLVAISFVVLSDVVIIIGEIYDVQREVVFEVAINHAVTM